MAEEAQFLARTLLEDSALLEFFRRDRDRLEEFTLRFIHSSLMEERGLHLEAIAAGGQLAKDRLQDANAELKSVSDEASQLGIRLRKLPSGRGLLQVMGQESAYYAIKYASQAVHTGRLVLSARFRTEDEETFTIHPDSTIDEVMKVGTIGLQSFTLANVATADLLAWDTLPSVEAFREHILGRLDGLILATGFEP
jgi:hypothetical protein